MSGKMAADIGCIVGAVGAVLVLVPRGRAAPLVGFALLTAAVGLLASALVPGEDIRTLVDTPARIVAVAVGALVLVVAGVVLSDRPGVVTVALLAVTPFRVPVHVGEQEAFLLIPLYAVLVVAVVGLVVRFARGRDFPELPRWMMVPAAAFIALCAISLLWSDDPRAGMIQLLFFLLPFSALVAFVARAPLERWSVAAFGVVVVVLACGFAGVGLSQLWTGELYFARDLEVANAYTSYFRTTSLFADSSVYGRELALGIVVLVVALWLARVSLVLGIGLIGLLWTALYFTYSQSSMVSLIVAVLGVSLMAADRVTRRVLVAGTLVAVVAAAVLVVVEVRDQPLERATSGRFELVENTWPVFVDHPVVGVGIGAQPFASGQQEGAHRQAERNTSHTTPLTVAAELGLLGILAYVVLLASVARGLLLVTRRDWALGLGLTGAFLLLFTHSLFYSGFFENPLTWGILAAAAAATATQPMSLTSRAPVGGGFESPPGRATPAA